MTEIFEETAESPSTASETEAVEEIDEVSMIEEEGDIAADYLEELLDIVDLDGDIDIEVRNQRIYLSVVNDDDGNEDMALILDITMRGGALYYDPQVAFMYRRHGGSDSSWRALEGTRFEEERGYYKTMAAEMDELGWKKAARVARIRFSSRAHALTLLPKAALAKKWQGVKNLAVHVVK